MKIGKSDKKRVITELKELKKFLNQQKKDAEKLLKKYKYTTNLINKFWDDNDWTDIAFIEDCLTEIRHFDLIERIDENY